MITVVSGWKLGLNYRFALAGTALGRAVAGTYRNPVSKNFHRVIGALLVRVTDYED